MRTMKKQRDRLLDPEVKTTHEDWYAQAWETEFGEILLDKYAESQPEQATTTDKTDDFDSTTQNEWNNRSRKSRRV